MSNTQTTDRSHGDAASTGTSVLLVEAETAFAESLASDDLSVRAVEGAGDALDQLDGVDCVVSNYGLPDGDGVTLLESVRERRPDLPFVLLAANGSERVASAAISADVTDYCPAAEVDAEGLRERVTAAVESTAVESETGTDVDTDSATDATHTTAADDATDSRIRALMTAFPDVAFLLDEEGYYHELLVGPSTEDLTATAASDIVGKRLHDVFPEEKADRYLDHIHHTLAADDVTTIEYLVSLSAGERWFEARTTPLGRRIDGKEAVVWVARDVTDRRERERRLERQHDELETLNQINQVIQEVVHGLVQAAGRKEIEQMVCDRLVGSGLYELAWTDDNEVDRQGVSPQTHAGGIDGYLDALCELGPLDEDPAGLSMKTGEVQDIQNVAETDILPDSVREEALARDIESGISIPLAYSNTIYGSLSMISTRSGVFSERAQAAFEILGEIIGFAINAAKNRKLLLSDIAVELEFRVTDSREVLLGISERFDCTCHLQGLVPAPEGRLLHYVRIVDAPSERVASAVDDAETVDECRLIGDCADGEECLLEVVMTTSTVKRLLEAGAAVESATADDGVVHLVAKAPRDADVRSIVDTFQAAYSESKLVSKRTVDRPIQTAQEFRQSLTDHLTDRQEMALKTAYHAGYYHWPRDSTAEEVADSLDVASSTLHYHLRKAQYQLLDAFFD